MIIKQISVFVENKKGRLSEILEVLAQHDIDVSSLSLADTSEFGVLRLIVNKVDEAKKVLREFGVIVKTTEVVAIAVDDVPGGAGKAVRLLNDNNISIEYMYACVGKTVGKALMVVRVNDNQKTEDLLKASGFNNLKPADIYRI